MKRSKRIALISISACLLLALLGLFGWRWYDRNVDRSGWLDRGGVTMYADFYGDPVTGWQEIEGSRYYFAADHSMQTGWLDTEDGTFYLGSDGKMQTLWLDTEEGLRYLGEDGILRTSWQTISNDRFYFDERGILQTGWVEIEKIRHYFHEDGILASGWQETEEGTCFLDENGTPISGWLTWEQARYCFDENGFLYTGWQQLEGECYYFSETGETHTGWQELDGSRFYFAEDGTMYTGWLEQGEYRYYLLDDGTAAVGKQEIDGKTYYFTPDGIWVLLVNPWHPLPGDYAPELVETEDGFLVAAQCQEALETMMEAMREEGLLPMFSSAYRSKTQQASIWQSYVNRYVAAGYSEARANAMTASYVAVPGTSEHHTGLVLDIVGYDYFYNGHYGSTRAVQAWLAEHCWEYGFILRYTKEKQPITGFAEETWHFRYVGTLVSLPMKNSGLCLEEYLGAIAPY